MFEYQDEEGIPWLRSRSRAMLADEPGLGKSRQALLASEGQTLVVAPAMIVEAGVWQDEHDLWTPELDLTIATYSNLCARKQDKNGRWTVPTQLPRPEYAGEWDTVIFDEAHYLKTRQTRWSLAAQRLRHQSLYLLTGTPIPNWAHELYVPIKMLHDRNDRRFSSYWRWVAQWFEVEQNYRSASKHARLVGELLEHHTWDEFAEYNLDGVYLRRKRADVLKDLPPTTEVTYEVLMEPKQARAYRELKRDYVTWLEDGTEIAAWSKAGQLIKLAQCSTGLEVITPDVCGSGKYRLMCELMSDRQGSPTVVCSLFRATARAAQTHLERMGFSVVTLTGATPKAARRDAVRDFQDGRYDVLVGTIEAMGEGLTLTAADTMIFLERSFRPSKNEQMMWRCNRIGQTRPVTVIHLITPKSVDSNMLKLLQTKTDHQMEALSAADLLALA